MQFTMSVNSHSRRNTPAGTPLSTRLTFGDSYTSRTVCDSISYLNDFTTFYKCIVCVYDTYGWTSLVPKSVVAWKSRTHGL